jgi:cell wall-associated NlpC family hydrolase
LLIIATAVAGTVLLPAAAAAADPLPLPAIGGWLGLAPAPAAPTVGQRALSAAQTRLGTPYRWGGTRPGGFDCSGLVEWSYAQAGVRLPRTSWAQSHVGRPVRLSDLRPGDVVIYNGGEHAALYAGDGRILHAPHTGDRVRYAPLHSMPILTARRL